MKNPIVSILKALTEGEEIQGTIEIDDDELIGWKLIPDQRQYGGRVEVLFWDIPIDEPIPYILDKAR